MRLVECMIGLDLSSKQKGQRCSITERREMEGGRAKIKNFALRSLLFGLFFILLTFQACQPGNSNEEEGSVLLAQVFNKKLFLSEMDGMFPYGTNLSDSLATIQAYKERWIRNALLRHEAEANLPPDFNIDKLVRAYRSSLITHNYEVALAQERLDSTISKVELNAFYEKNKEQYQLETPIIRCHFIKAKLPIVKGEQLRKLWNSNKPEDFETLLKYCDKYEVDNILTDSTWYDLEDIAAELPAGTLTASNVSSKKDFSQRDVEYQYYFRLFEAKNRKDIAPLSYIEEQARKVILHNRKSRLISDIKEELYEREMRGSNIKVFDYK